MPRRARRTGSDEFPGFGDVTEIGGGAFSTVYRAVELDTDRPVALKLLKVGNTRAHLIDSFQSEMRALAAASGHPNIVTLYRAVTTTDGRPILVLELCRGSLAQRLQTSGALPAAEVLATGIKVSGALETAHRAGFLHRDLKPQNILVTQYGEPALADFGVAALQAAAQATEGVFGFTTLHASPEVLEGRPLSPATDVYGLASTLYQLVTGKAPFAALASEAPAAVILRILRDPVRPVVSAEVPVALSDLLAAALSKDPAQRPQSAEELGQALRTIERHAGFGPSAYVVWGDEWHGAARPGPADPEAPAPSATPAAAPRARGGPPAAPPAAPPPRHPPAVPVPTSGPAAGHSVADDGLDGPSLLPGPQPPPPLVVSEVTPAERGIVSPGRIERHVLAPGPTAPATDGARVPPSATLASVPPPPPPPPTEPSGTQALRTSPARAEETSAATAPPPRPGPAAAPAEPRGSSRPDHAWSAPVTWAQDPNGNPLEETAIPMLEPSATKAPAREGRDRVAEDGGRSRVVIVVSAALVLVALIVVLVLTKVIG